MSMDTYGLESSPVVGTDDPIIGAHLATQTQLLARLLAQLEQNEGTPFTIRSFVAAGGSPQRVTAAARGVITMFHNPTGAPLNIQLSFGGSGERVLVNLTLAANSAQPVKFNFHEPLYLVAGSGVVISGQYFS